MIYVEAPNYEYPKDKVSIFLAGSITDCPDWNSEVVNKLKDEDIVIFNPRRKNFPIEDPKASDEQIRWEFTMLRNATIIPFWFSKETLGPIVLYELGAHSMTNKPICIGVDKEYKRKQDVVIQTLLVRPDIKITNSFEKHINNIKELIRKEKK